LTESCSHDIAPSIARDIGKFRVAEAGDEILPARDEVLPAGEAHDKLRPALGADDEVLAARDEILLARDADDKLLPALEAGNGASVSAVHPGTRAARILAEVERLDAGLRADAEAREARLTTKLLATEAIEAELAQRAQWEVKQWEDLVGVMRLRREDLREVKQAVEGIAAEMAGIRASLPAPAPAAPTRPSIEAPEVPMPAPPAVLATTREPKAAVWYHQLWRSGATPATTGLSVGHAWKKGCQIRVGKRLPTVTVAIKGIL